MDGSDYPNYNALDCDLLAEAIVEIGMTVDEEIVHFPEPYELLTFYDDSLNQDIDFTLAQTPDSFLKELDGEINRMKGRTKIRISLPRTWQRYTKYYPTRTRKNLVRTRARSSRPRTRSRFSVASRICVGKSGSNDSGDSSSEPPGPGGSRAHHSLYYFRKIKNQFIRSHPHPTCTWRLPYIGGCAA